MMDTTTAWN